jgi:hypothetical protein
MAFFFQWLKKKWCDDTAGITDTLPGPGPLRAYFWHSWYFISMVVLCFVMHVLAEMGADMWIYIYNLLVLRLFVIFRYNLRTELWMKHWNLLSANCQMKMSRLETHPVTIAVLMVPHLLIVIGAKERLLHTGIHPVQYHLLSVHCPPIGTHLQSAVLLAVRPLAPQAL